MFVINAMMPAVISLSPEMSIDEAARTLLRHRISGAPVIDQNHQMVGFLSEGDFLRRVEISTDRDGRCWLAMLRGSGKLAEDYIHEHSRKVSDVMTKVPLITVKETTDLGAAVELMEKHKIKHLPVMRRERVVGMLTRANLIYALMARGQKVSGSPISDRKLTQAIFDEIEKMPWAPVPLIHVDVLNGNVRLSGAVYDGRQRQALQVLVENFAGVRSVNNEIVWIEPMSGTVLMEGENRASKQMPIH